MSGLIGIPPLKDKNPRPNADAGDATDLVRDVDQTEFAEAVIEGSMERPVIVDFWADWCGPCKSLAPVLEKVVTEAGGAVTLAKVDTEANQQLAAQLRIQSLPTVYAFFQGRPVDGFQGNLPESEVRAFVEKLINETGATAPDGQDPQVEAAIAQANSLLESDQPEAAEQIATQIIGAIGLSPEVALLMCKALSAQNKDEALEEFIAGLDETTLADPEVKAFQSGLALRKEGEGLPSLSDLRAQAANGDPESRFQLARKLLSVSEREEAADILLSLFKEDRDWNNGAAKSKLLEIFNIYGNADPFTLTTRRKFSALHYS